MHFELISKVLTGFSAHGLLCCDRSRTWSHLAVREHGLTATGVPCCALGASTQLRTQHLLTADRWSSAGS
eukprot:SAG31_NODE_4544_length_3150_cov_1.620125_4_plen_70_part_00